MTRADSRSSVDNGMASSDAISTAPLLTRVLARFEQRSPTVERRLLLIAAVVFVGAAIVGFANLPDLEHDVRWPLLLLAGAGLVPLAVGINAVEFMVAARIVERRVPLLDAFRVSVLSTAANVFPIPGAVVVKTRALRQLGSGYRRALASTAVVGISWVALSGVVAGTLLLLADEPALGGSLLAAGAVGLALAWILVHRGRSVGRAGRLMLSVVAVELLSVASAGIRLWLVLRGIGFDASVADAFTFAVTAIVASAIGIFPGGLGIREVLAGAISPVIGIAVAVGLVATTVDRLLTYGSLAVMAGVLVGVDARARRMVREGVADEEVG